MSELTELLDELQAADTPRARLYGLSNLSHEQVAEVEAVWSELPVETRRALVDTLVDMAESDYEVNFVPVFRMAMGDADSLVRRRAIEGLWEDSDIRLIPLLAARLREDPSPEVRAAAATSLGRFVLLGELGKIRPLPHKQAYDALLAACRKEGETLQVQRRALESIAYSGEEEIASLIQNAYQQPEESMRISAVFAMGRSADKRWARCVLEQLCSASPEMRFEATRACGELALEEALAALIELVDDADPEVHEAAIWALGQVGGDEAQSVLRQTARADNEATREAALDALRELQFLHGDLGALLFPLDSEEEEGEEDEEEEDIL
jgi:HEAT repeat protein